MSVMKRIVGCLLLLLLLCGGVFGAVPIDFFYEPGCQDCERIAAELLPEIDARFGSACAVQSYDIGIETNFLYLLQLEDHAGHAGPERGYLIVNKQVVFGSAPDPKAVFSAISHFLESEPAEAVVTADGSSVEIERRFRGFTFFAVLVAGLLDGINPCAISTLVFFMSLLAVSTRFRQGAGVQAGQRKKLVVLGASYCFASFLTYLAIGFGLFRVLHLFSGFTVLRGALEWGMIGLLLIFAVLSFRDAFRFRKTRDGHDVSLQLSTGMKKRIHAVMRRGLKTGHLVSGGLLIGTLVTALESVCTGQVYVPTLVLILKNHAQDQSRAWLYLILYNLLFILPLVLTFIAVYWGLRTETLLRWSRRNVVISKLLLALFFISTAILIRYL